MFFLIGIAAYFNVVSSYLNSFVCAIVIKRNKSIPKEILIYTSQPHIIPPVHDSF